MISPVNMSKESHIERTSKEPRDVALHKTTIAEIDEINPTIRVFRLAIPPGETIKFLPGQWLDVYIPALPDLQKPGGFTITSAPSSAVPVPVPVSSSPSHSSSPNHNSNPNSYPYLELAIQRSPDNPWATYLWQSPPSLLLQQPLHVRVGGSFVYPPPSPPPPPSPSSDLFPASTPPPPPRKVVFIAGGVGVNPLMSMLTALAEAAAESEDSSSQQKTEVHFLYSMRDPGPPRDARGMLFLERIAGIFSRGTFLGGGGLRLFLTPGEPGGGGGGGAEEGGREKPPEQGLVSCSNGLEIPFQRRRIALDDIAAVLGQDRDSAVVYICGVPSMTDYFVERLTAAIGLGMDSRRVLYEKWW